MVLDIAGTAQFTAETHANGSLAVESERNSFNVSVVWHRVKSTLPKVSLISSRPICLNGLDSANNRMVSSPSHWFFLAAISVFQSSTEYSDERSLCHTSFNRHIIFILNLTRKPVSQKIIYYHQLKDCRLNLSLVSLFEHSTNQLNWSWWFACVRHIHGFYYQVRAVPSITVASCSSVSLAPVTSVESSVRFEPNKVHKKTPFG